MHFLCVFCFLVCVFLCRGTFSVLGGETTVLKSSQKNRILFSLNQNHRHVQPSRVLRHGNRRATGRTHRNDGASSRKHSFSFSREEHHYSKRSLLLLLRCLEEEKNLDRHFLDRFFFLFILLRRFVYDIARARGVLCAGPTRSRASRPSPRILLTRTLRLNNDFTAPSGRVPENG